MTDAETLKAGRTKLGLSLNAMGLSLGYAPSPHLRTEIHKMEAGKKPVPAARMKILELILKSQGFQE